MTLQMKFDILSAVFHVQLMYLSQERLSFGNLPLFSRARRMVFVTNRAKDRDVSFEWHVTSQADAQVNYHTQTFSFPNSMSSVL